MDLSKHLSVLPDMLVQMLIATLKNADKVWIEILNGLHPLILFAEM